MVDPKLAKKNRGKLWPPAVMLLVIFASGPASAATSVKASAGEVSTFLAGHSGKLVYSDENDGGKCYWIDLNDMSVHKLSDDVDCNEPLFSPDGSRVVYGQYQTADKYDCSGVNLANAYIQALSGGSPSQVGGVAINANHAFAPHWWVDPGNGDEYIVSMDAYCKDKQDGSDRSTWKQKIVANQASGDPIQILKHAFDGGLSQDGKRVGEAYHYLHLAQTMDLGGGDGTTISPRLDGGSQCCNSSMSPDNQYQVMHLRLDHEGCNIHDWDDNNIQTIWKPSGATEMQNPEFSTHPGYSTFTALFGGSYYIYLANTATGDNLKIAEGNFSYPHLWVGTSEPTLQLQPGSLSFSAQLGAADPTAQTVLLSNAGSGTLDELSLSNNAAWLSVSRSGTGNSQSLQNTVSIAGLSEGSYDSTVTVSCANAGNSPQSYTVSLTVTVPGADSQDPAVSIASPAAAETVSAFFTVTGTASDDTALAQIEVQANDGAWRPATGLSSWSFSLNTTVLPNGPATINARATDTSNNTALDSVAVDIDNGVVVPKITVLAPNGGEVWPSGSQQQIRWSTEGLSDVTLAYSIDDGQNWQNIAISVDLSSPDWEVYPWTIPDESSPQCLVLIKGYFGEAPTQSAQVFEIAPPDSTDAGLDQILIQGSCSCTTSANQPFLPILLLIFALALLVRRP